MVVLQYGLWVERRNGGVGVIFWECVHSLSGCGQLYLINNGEFCCLVSGMHIHGVREYIISGLERIVTMFEQYEHQYGDGNSEKVWVRSELKGKHREHCLCWSCKKCKPGEPDHCKKAALLYAFCRAFGMVTPVWECPDADLREE